MRKVVEIFREEGVKQVLNSKILILVQTLSIRLALKSVRILKGNIIYTIEGKLKITLNLTLLKSLILEILICLN